MYPAEKSLLGQTVEFVMCTRWGWVREHTIQLGTIFIHVGRLYDVKFAGQPLGAVFTQKR